MRKLFLAKSWILPVVVTALLLTTGSAYALFSSTLNFGQVSVSVGSAALEVHLPDGTVINQDQTQGYALTGLYPGLSQSYPFTLKNVSTAPITLEMSAQLVSTDGDWDVLKDVITARVKDADSSSSTGYKTLAQWNAQGGIALPKTLTPGQSHNYSLDIQIDKKYGNELSGKSLTNMHVSLTATQED